MAANRHSLPSACRVPRLWRPLPCLGGHTVPATAHRPLLHAPRTIQASSRFTDGGARARDSGSSPESAPGNRLPRRRPRGITGYAPCTTAGQSHGVYRRPWPQRRGSSRREHWAPQPTALFQEPARPASRASRRDRLQPSAQCGHRNTALAPGTAPCAPAPPDSPRPPQRRLPPRPPPTTAGLAGRRLPTRPGRLHHPPRGATGQAEPGSTHTRLTPQALGKGDPR